MQVVGAGFFCLVAAAFFLRVLDLVQMRIHAAPDDEFGVRAGFDDAPMLHNDDPVGIFDGRQPVCDDQRGAPLHEGIQRVLHAAFRFRIECRGRFVKNQDRRIFQEGAGNRQPLPLPAGKFDAFFAHQRVETLRHRFDEFERVRGFGGGVYFLTAGVATRAVGDIGGDGVVEQDDLLADQRDMAECR